MTETTVGATPRLPVIASVARAYRNVIARPVVLARVATLPGAVMVAITYAIAASPLWGQSWAVAAFLLLVLPLLYAGQAWLRHSLLGEPTPLRMIGDQIRCYGRLLPLGIALSIWLLVVPLCVVVAGSFLLMELADEPWKYVPYLRDGLIPGLLWLGLMALFTLPAGRFFLFVPAVSIGQWRLLRMVWRSGSGHGLSISVALILLLLTFAIIEIFLLLCVFIVIAALDDLSGSNGSFMDPKGLRNACGVAMLFIGALVGTILSAELLAIAFRQLTGWSAPQAAILERFD